MPTFTFHITSLKASPRLREIEIDIEDEIGGIVNGVGEEELLEYIGKEAAIKYFDILEHIDEET